MSVRPVLGRELTEAEAARLPRAPRWMIALYTGRCMRCRADGAALCGLRWAGQAGSWTRVALCDRCLEDGEADQRFDVLRLVPAPMA